MYLGKLFSAQMDNEEAKNNILNKLTALLKKLTNLPIKPQTKLKILRRVVYPRISFELKVYDFSLTWIKNSLDAVVTENVRKWLELPINTCVKEVVRLPSSMCGLNVPALSTYATNLRLTIRHLKTSQNQDIRHLWASTMSDNVNIDSTLLQAGTLAKAKKSITLQVRNSALQHITSLQLQGKCITSVVKNIKARSVTIWTNCKRDACCDIQLH